MKPLVFNPVCGTSIDAAVRECLGLSQRYNRPVRLRFNGIRLRVTKRLSARHLLRQFDEMMHARRERYRRSPEGWSAAVQLLEHGRRLQQKMDHLMRLLRPFLVPVTRRDVGRLDLFMQWLAEFLPCADHVGVTFDEQVLYRQLLEAGFHSGEYVGQAPEWFDRRERMGPWIVGQVMSSLAAGRAIPQVARTFIERYFALPAHECLITDHRSPGTSNEGGAA